MKQLAGRIWRHLMHDSLYRNSMYLLMNTGITALSGFLFWAIATRLYSAHDVGYATALFGALGLASSLSNLGMNRTVIRFLGGSETQSRDIVTKLSLVALGAFAAGAILSCFLRSFGIEHPTIPVVAVFVAAAVFTSVKILFDNVFIALKSASGTLIENTVFSVVKLVLPVVFVSFGFIGIVSAQMVAAAGAVIVSVCILRARHAYRLRTRPARGSMSGKWSFALGSYSSDIIGSLPANVLPIIVVAKLGPVDGALWYIAMLMVNLLLALSSAINQAMFAEISNTTAAIWSFVKKAARTMYGLVAPIAIVLALFAPFVLSLFGHQYADATPILRVMALFALVGIINYITGSILAYYKKVLYLTIVNIINAVVVGVYCLLFATDLQGIAVGWIAGEIANVILFVVGCVYFSRRADTTNTGASGAKS